MYRDLPWAFKPFFWFYTDEINVAMGTTDSDSGDAKTTESGYQIDTTPYITNDAGFYEKLSSTQKLLSLIHIYPPADWGIGPARVRLEAVSRWVAVLTRHTSTRALCGLLICADAAACRNAGGRACA